MTIIIAVEDREDLCSCQLTVLTQSQAQTIFDYLDIAVLSIANTEFQYVLLSMKFDSKFYSLFSEKVKR